MKRRLLERIDRELPQLSATDRVTLRALIAEPFDELIEALRAEQERARPGLADRQQGR